MTNKYGARKVHADGHTFDSRAEHRRWCELKLLQQAGEIHGLQAHPIFNLLAHTETGPKSIGKYTPDFVYMRGNVRVVEDVKGANSQKGAARSDYRLRVRLLEANHPDIEFHEIGGRKPSPFVTIGDAAKRVLGNVE